MDAARGWFVDFMDSGALGPIGLAIFALWPCYVLLVTAHELGHAVAALLLTSGRVFLRVGRAPGLVRTRLGRLDVSWHLDGRRGQDDGGIVLEEWIVDPNARLAFALAGPAANLFVAVLLVPTYAALSGAPRVVVGLCILASVAAAAMNLLPASPGSDGREALLALRDRGETNR